MEKHLYNLMHTFYFMDHILVGTSEKELNFCSKKKLQHPFCVFYGNLPPLVPHPFSSVFVPVKLEILRIVMHPIRNAVLLIVDKYAK